MSGTFDLKKWSKYEDIAVVAIYIYMNSMFKGFRFNLTSHGV